MTLNSRLKKLENQLRPLTAKELALLSDEELSAEITRLLGGDRRLAGGYEQAMEEFSDEDLDRLVRILKNGENDDNDRAFIESYEARVLEIAKDVI